jgi:hypothetical protein
MDHMRSLEEKDSMYRLLARRRARVRCVILGNGSMDHDRSVASPQQGADASSAQSRYQLNYAKWYAALAAPNGRPGDRAYAGNSDARPSIDFRDSLIPEADAA